MIQNQWPVIRDLMQKEMLVIGYQATKFNKVIYDESLEVEERINGFKASLKLLLKVKAKTCDGYLGDINIETNKALDAVVYDILQLGKLNENAAKFFKHSFF